jgi:hypothetical protein
MARRPLAEFRNEPYADFSKPGNARAMRAALAQVRSTFGQEQEIRIGAERFRTGSLLDSLNPSNRRNCGRFHGLAPFGKGCNSHSSFPCGPDELGADRSPQVRGPDAMAEVRVVKLVLEAGRAEARSEADTSGRSISRNTPWRSGWPPENSCKCRAKERASISATGRRKQSRVNLLAILAG